MKSTDHTFRFWLPILSLAALATLLVGCIIGGTGTDTENGITDNKINQSALGITARIVDTSGNPVPGVLLTAVQPSFRPDSVNPTVLNYAVSNDVSQKEVVSNAQGQVGFSLSTSGTYIVEGSKAGQKLFFDTLKIADVKIGQPLTFHARPLHKFQGRVKLASGMRIDSGKVFVRGTSVVVQVDAAGAYNLGLLPFDISKMAIGLRFHSSPTGVVEIHQSLIIRPVDTLVPVGPGQVPVALGPTSFLVSFTCTEAPKDSSGKLLFDATPINLDTGNAAGGVLLKDSVRVSAALRTCGSIRGGTLVNLRPLEASPATLSYISGEIKDSVNGSFLVPNLLDAPATPSADQVVPYTHCVSPTGAEKSTLEIKLEETLLGTDLLVRDLNRSCAVP